MLLLNMLEATYRVLGGFLYKITKHRTPESFNVVLLRSLVFVNEMSHS
jgi:hypothetical protein